MIRTAVLLLFCLGFAGSSLYGQYYLNENKNWIFGSAAWLDFNSGSPPSGAASAAIAKMSANVCEADASVSDANGQLLFYTNGSVIWDRNHTEMPNANTLHAFPQLTTTVTESSCQGALIVPVPDSPQLYYVFSLTNIEMVSPQVRGQYYSAGALYYSVVDMGLNGGLGDVIPGRKWMLVDTGFTEKMIAIRGNRCNVWILSHAKDTTMYRAYEVNRNGFNPVPVVSYYKGEKGVASLLGENVFWNSGQMAISPDRTRLVETYPHRDYRGLLTGVVELYNFDPNTGRVSDPFLLDAYGNYPWGACFSPDNSKLYVSYRLPDGMPDSVYQFDLNAVTPQAVRQSRAAVAPSYYAHLQLGPDGKIYFPKHDNPAVVLATPVTTIMSSIEQPNLPGVACQYVPQAVAMTGGARLGMPNLVVTALPGGDTLHIRSDTVLCHGHEGFVFQAPPGYDTYLWDDGSSGMTRTVTAPGVYRVISRDDCHTRMDSFVVHPEPFQSLVSERTMCENTDTIVLHVPGNHGSYAWDDGSTDSFRVVDGPGIYYVHMQDVCAARTDTFLVQELSLAFSLGSDTVICDGSPLWLSAPDGDAQRLWQDGSTDSMFRVMQTGTYRLELTSKGCRSGDTISVYITDVSQDLGADKIFCHREEIAVTLEAHVPPGGVALWDNGSNEHYRHVADTGVYRVIVSDMECTGSDTIQISKEYCDCFWEIPTAFTPNGDGRNDIFRAVAEPGCPVSKYILVVYNRWGEVVFRSYESAAGWDGYYNGEPADIGTYFYITEVEIPGGWKQRKQGDVTLVR